MSNPAPTTRRGKSSQAAHRARVLRRAQLDHEAYRRKSIADGFEDPGDWPTWAADCDARNVVYGTPGHPTSRRMYTGVYPEELYAAAVAEHRARKAQVAEAKSAWVAGRPMPAEAKPKAKTTTRWDPRTRTFSHPEPVDSGPRLRTDEPDILVRFSEA